MMKFSVVIPTYNRKELLEETLDNIFAQDYQNIEVIVVDDNSTDKTLGMLEAYAKCEARLHYCLKPLDSPKGPSSSRNLGAALATGDYIHFFDSDDLLACGFYSALAQRLEAKPDAFVCRIKWFSETAENVVDASGEFSKENFLAKAVTHEHEFWTQNIVWRSDYLGKFAVLYDERLSMSEDIEFATRMLVGSECWQAGNDLFVLVRRHSNSLTFISNLSREKEIAYSRFVAHKSLLDTVPDNELTSAAKIKCSFVMRQSLLFLLKTNGPDRFFIRHFLDGFSYSPLRKWPGYIINIIKNIALFVGKGSKWESHGGHGRAF